MNAVKKIYLWQNETFGLLLKLLNPALLVMRLYIAQIFFLSGLTKLRDWDSTLFLFQEEYHVPLLPPELAAYLGTGGELLLSPLLALGLLTRFSTIGLFIVNLAAALSLPDMTQAAINLHILWGTTIGLLAVLGGGFISADTVVVRYLNEEDEKELSTIH